MRQEGSQLGQADSAAPAPAGAAASPRIRAMSEATQFCVGLKNNPGTFAALCSALFRTGVRVQAVFNTEDKELCWVYLVMTPVEAAQQALHEAGYSYFTERVLLIEVEDRAGELEKVASRLAAAGINIDYVYGASVRDEAFSLVLRASDMTGAREALESQKSSREPRRS